MPLQSDYGSMIQSGPALPALPSTKGFATPYGSSVTGPITGALGGASNVLNGVSNVGNAISGVRDSLFGNPQAYNGQKTTSDQKQAVSSNTAANQAIGTSTQQYIIPGAQQNYQSLADQYRQGYGNLQQYLESAYGQLTPDITGAYNRLAQQANGLVDSYGQTERQQLGNAYQQAGAQQSQSLINRGLGNTTVQDSIQQGLGNSKALADLQLSQQINQAKLGVLGQYGTMPIQAQEQLQQQRIAQVLAQALAGQQAQQGLGSQYLGLVGQQGIRQTGTTEQGQQLSQQQQQSMDNSNQQFSGVAPVGANGTGMGDVSNLVSSGGGSTSGGFVGLLKSLLS